MKFAKMGVIGVALVTAGCNPLVSLCEGRVASATQTTSRSSYKSGYQSGIAAAFACIDKEGGRSELAVERCKKQVR